MKQNIFNNIIFTIVFVLASFCVFSNNSSSQGISLFNQKQYHRALIIFELLYQQDSSNTQYAYYYGACLSETSQMGQQAIDLLNHSAQGSAPVAHLLYLGKNHHALANYQLAANYYNQYFNLLSRKERKAQNIEQLILQAQNNENPFAHLLAPIPEVGEVQAEPEIVSISIPPQLLDTLINFQIISQVQYLRTDQFKLPKAQQAFIEGWVNQTKLDSVLAITSQLRQEYNTASFNEKESLANKIIENEQFILNTKNLADQNFNNARSMETEYWANATPLEIRILQSQNDSITKAWQAANTPAIPEPVEPVYVIDSVSVADSTFIDTPTEVQQEELEEAMPALPQINATQIVYKVQIGTSKGKLPAKTEQLFKRLSILRRIDVNTNENGLDVYTIGELSNFEDAVRLQQQIRLEGIKDAFVVVFHQGKRITLDEAKIISGQ